MPQPRLFFTVGLPGSGKTTKAKELENKFHALRFTPDEWILDIFGHQLDREQRDAARDPVEQTLWKCALRALDIGVNVVIDFGFWSVEERKRFREEGEQHGALVNFVFCDAPKEVLWERISSRSESQSGTLHITREDLEEWHTRFESMTSDEQNFLYTD